MNQETIRNFCIIAHIDHGKSTLADRLLELTGTIDMREMREQVLDQMDLEREKGITIKMQPVRMVYKLLRHEPRAESRENNSHDSKLMTHDSQVEYQLNLIDTPGHVDFSYEVSRSLQAVEGALLVVDATQGIQAQTLANVYLAIEAGLEIIPIINKIDLPAAEPERIAQDIAGLLGGTAESVHRISAKTGIGVPQILEAIVAYVPSPKGAVEAALRALIFDSTYDEYRGVILSVRVVDGKLSKNMAIRLMGSAKQGEALEVGVLTPARKPMESLNTGEIGYVVTNLRSVSEGRVGDTLTAASNPSSSALPGYLPIKPFIFAGFFPATAEQYELLKEALAKLQLNDAALQFTPESSSVLGFGFRVGFLGLLHLEIIKERLEREYRLELIISNPTTAYEVLLTSNELETVRAASELPDTAKLQEIREAWIKGEVVTPKDYLGNVIKLISDVRGAQKNLEFLDVKTALVAFEAPLSNVLTNFYDRLKSITSGYGSFNYELSGYRAGDLAKLDILVSGTLVDSLSQIVHREEVLARGRATVSKLREVIPRQLFEVSLQAAVGGKIIAREDIKPLGKNVAAKLYGGDISRKKKLWAKQKAGKRRLKKLGKVDIPAEAFTVMLRKD